MTLNANIRPRVIPNRILYIKRKLLGQGSLNIKPNTEVSPHDILGKSTLIGGFSSINISKKLGISPSEGTKYLQRELGKTIFKGELLALKKGLLGKKIITAPTDGVLESYDSKTGDIRMRFIPKEVALTAGVYGVVEDVNTAMGEVTIKTMATEIYGIFGFGLERGGILEMVGDQNNLLQPHQISSKMNQHIIVGGALIYKDTLRKAASVGVQGIIGGGINIRDFSAMVGDLDPNSRLNTDIGQTIVATEGFGPMGIGADIYQFLKENDGRYVFINGNQRKLLIPSINQDSLIAVKKVVLPLSKGPTDIEMQIGELQMGQKVRLIWPPLMGAQGKIISLDQTPTLLPSGIATYLVGVETSKQKIKVPFTNLEII